ncbi:MAG TPA: hypothetical protein VNZ25_10330, partial [Candidatus Angelobacter sp.]|nr:hypothetical protein [Candidatus Angelobacter sp.]
QAIWAICLVAFAFVCLKKDVMESLLFYVAVLVATSPAITIQYLAIPLVFIATRVNCVTVIYTILATVVLVVHPNGLRISGIFQPMFPNIPIYVLALAVAWSAWQPQITAASRFLYGWLKAELHNQLGSKITSP